MLKKILSVVLSLFLLTFTASSPPAAYQTTTFHLETDHLTLCTNHNGAYLLNYLGGACHVEKLSPNTYGADLQLNLAISVAGVFNDTVVAICNDTQNRQTVVYTYRADTDILNNFVIANSLCESSYGYCYDGSIYLVPDNRLNTIERYNGYGKLIDSYRFDNRINQLYADYNGKPFAICADGTLYRMKNDRFIACGSGVTAPVTYFSENLLSDASGKVFESDFNRCRYLFTADSPYGRSQPCCIDGVVYYPDNHKITGYNSGTGEKESELSLDSSVIGLYADSGYINAVGTSTEVTVNKIRTDELTSLKHKAAENISYRDTEQISGGERANGNDTITSDIYHIDFENYSISGIPSGTTLAQLKKNIDYGDFTVTFYRDGTVKKSGNCGTAMTAVFDSDRAQYTFELSVIGDITGEGNVNSRDRNLLMEYLIGSADFNGVYVTSADLSGDGILDVKDLALLHRMIA